MFMYVSIAIGFFPNPVHTRFLLGAVGISVVLMSLFSGMGLTFFGNQELTMISAEVVPFLILAIGVDNMFLIARAERSINKQITDPRLRMAYALKEMGPSIFAAAFCEALAFFIGLLTDVPALRNFCLVAGCGVVMDFFLQMTIFVGALSLDNMRVNANRGDIFCCFYKFEEKKPRRRECFRHIFQTYFVPSLFTNVGKVLVMCTTTFLVIIGFMSCFKL
jgi:Niemann-Pick C1 protein